MLPLRMVFCVLQKAETALNKIRRILVDVADPVRESMRMWNIGWWTRSIYKTHFFMKWLRGTGSTSDNMSKILDSTRHPFQLSLVSFSFGVRIHCSICAGEELANSTVQLVQIYFDTASYDETERDKKIKFEAQLSLIGGTMGLLTGFSIISGFEIFCFLIKLLGNAMSSFR